MNEYNEKYFKRFCEPYRILRLQEESKRGFKYGYESDLAFERCLVKRFDRYNERYPFGK